MSTFGRLLDRRSPDGSLALADPALLRMATAAMREELRRVEAGLAGSLSDPTNSDRPRTEALTAVVAKLSSLLAILEGAIDEADA